MKRKLIKAVVLMSLLAAVTVVVLAFSSCSHLHMLTDVKVIKAATCTEEGEMESACECGYVEKSTIPTTEHLAGAWEITKQPTCEASGSQKLSCRVCGTTMDTANIAARGHDIVEVAAKAATCSEVGHNAYKYCAACEYTTYVEVDRKAHTPGAEATCTTPQYCSVCEMTVSDALGHVRLVTEGTPATCTKEGVSDEVECTRCKEIIEESIEIPQRQHVIVEIPGYAATCTEKGLSSALVCLVCDEEIAEAVVLPAGSGEHNFTGSTSKCEYCGIKEKDYDDCEHGEEAKNEDDEDESWLDDKDGKNATCVKYGYSDWEYCVECGKITKALEIIAPSEHNIETIDAIGATLTTPGLSEGLKCKNVSCKITVRQQEIIPVISTASLGNSSAALNGGALSYAVNDDDITCTVTGIGTCKSKDIVIPEYIDGFRVTAIGDEAFYGNASVETITIPASVTKIGDEAFSACLLLTKVTMSDGTELGDDVFFATSGVTVEFTHTLIYIAKEVPERCDKPGVNAHYICVYCCNRYTDKDAKNQTFDVEFTTSHEFEDEKCEECKSTIEDVTIIDIYSIPSLKVNKGTFAKDLNLPATVTGITEYENKDGEDVEVEVTLKVIWDIGDYDGDVSGTYEATGHICFGQYQTRKNLSKTVTAKIEVK